MAAPTNTAELVLRALQKHQEAVTAKQLSLELSLPRKDVNQALYVHLQGQVIRTNTEPPLWRLVQTSAVVQPASLGSLVHDRLVLVDLGNVHDCLEPLGAYAMSDPTLCVEAYADVGFKGYGVCPPAPHPIQVFVATSPHKNAADVKMIFNTACRAMQLIGSGKTMHFIFATKDKGFHSMKEELEALGHKVDFVTDWAELRLFIE